MTIPKIIHQIAPEDKTKWHPIWFVCQQSWLKHFPDFEYKLWNDKEDIDSFVKTNYPEFFNLYNSFPVHIMKIDFVRLCFLHKYGGIYGDMDYFVYKNFYNELNADVGFLENLTEEYTTAQYENSLMYCTPQNKFIYELMKYTKTCFIQLRNLFNITSEDWRSTGNDFIINNSTGSGMISEGVKFFKKYINIGYLDCRTFNNRPASFDKSFFGKHVHSSLWGNEYCNNKPTHFLIKRGILFQTYGDKKDDINIKDFDMYTDHTNNSCLIEDNIEKTVSLKIEDLDMYTDYTQGNYLKESNLEELRKYLSVSYNDS